MTWKQTFFRPNFSVVGINGGEEETFYPFQMRPASEKQGLKKKKTGLTQLWTRTVAYSIAIFFKFCSIFFCHDFHEKNLKIQQLTNSQK